MCRMMLGCMLALSVAVAALPAQGQELQRRTFSVSEYHQTLSDPTSTAEANLDAVAWYLVGLMSGIVWLEEDAAELNLKPLSCPPEDALNGRDKLTDLIAREMKRNPDLWPKDSPQPLARLVIAALRHEFPCR